LVKINSKYLTTDEVASTLGISRPTVINYIKKGRLEAIRSGKSFKIPIESFVRFSVDENISDNPLSLLTNFPKITKKTTSFEADISNKKLHLNTEPIKIEESANELYYLSAQLDGARYRVCLRIREAMFVIGRHSFASFSIQDSYVSNTHLILSFQEGTITLRDQSTNGTIVGGKVLRYGEFIQIGDTDEFIAGRTVFEIISPQRIDNYLDESIV